MAKSEICIHYQTNNCKFGKKCKKKHIHTLPAIGQAVVHAHTRAIKNAKVKGECMNSAAQKAYGDTTRILKTFNKNRFTEDDIKKTINEAMRNFKAEAKKQAKKLAQAHAVIEAKKQALGATVSPQRGRTRTRSD